LQPLVLHKFKTYVKPEAAVTVLHTFKTYVKPEAAITVIELLMMGGVSPETC